MSIPDELMVKYYRLATDLPMEELESLEKGLEEGSIHPRDAKMNLGAKLVEMYHSKESAQQAKEYFQTVFQKRSLPTDIPEVKWEGESPIWIVELLVELKMMPSKGEARRMIQNGGVKINEEKVSDVQLQVELEDGLVIQVGKRKFVKIMK